MRIKRLHQHAIISCMLLQENCYVYVHACMLLQLGMAAAAHTHA